MENDKASNETIPLSVVGENKTETPENNVKKASSPGELDLADEKPHVEKTITQETFNIEIPEIPQFPDYTPDLPQDSNNVTSPSKTAASTDVPDGFNGYRNKKTLTQGLMDVALFSANISQLSTVMDQMSRNDSNTAYAGIMIFMLVVSILLQVGVGLLLLLSTRYNLNSAEDRRLVYQYGNYVVAGIFLITVINVFISAFHSPGDRYRPSDYYRPNGPYPMNNFTSIPHT